LADKKVILTIDDEKFIRTSFKTFLEDFGYDVLEAGNGIEGIKIFKKYQPDLILLDLRMPEMDGFGVLKNVLAISPDTPIIVVSGVGIIKDAVEAIRQGATDYVLKPIQDLDILRYSISRALEKADLVAQNKKYQEKLEEMVEERTSELASTNDLLSEEINHRKQTELKLQNSQQMLTSILETVPDIIYRLDNNGKINFISDAVKNYGYLPSDFIDKYIHELVHPEDQENAYWHVRTRRSDFRKTMNYEIRLFPYSDETNYPIFMLESEGIYSSNINHCFIGTQGVARDITLRKEAEDKIKKSLKEKESLLREVHHRVKNNMQVILSLLNLQMREIDSVDIQNILKESQNRIQSMAIVHESIYKTTDFSHIRIVNFIKSLYMQIATSYDMQSEIKVNYNINEVFVSLDSSVPLAIILNEIFTNIFKHAFDNFKNANINIHVEKIDDKFAKVFVEDNGCGISEEIDPYSPDSMGLSLIKTLTKQINGEMTVERLDPGTKTSIVFNTKINQSSL